MSGKKEEAVKSKAITTQTAPGAVGAVIDYGSDAGAGFENQTKADISIPFIAVLQPMSPQITNMNDAKPGMLFNTVTEELFKADSGLLVVPATTKHVYVEWVPREKGGGFVAVHEVTSDVVKQALASSKEFGKYTLPNGNQLSETFYVYGVLIDENDETLGMATIAFTSTKIAAYKRWNTKVNMFTVKTPDGRKVRPPLFAHKVRVTSVKEKNAKGEFFNFNLAPANGGVAESLLPPGHPTLEAAKELRQMVDSGAAKAAYETQGGEAPADGANPNWNV